MSAMLVGVIVNTLPDLETKEGKLVLPVFTAVSVTESPSASE